MQSPAGSFPRPTRAARGEPPDSSSTGLAQSREPRRPPSPSRLPRPGAERPRRQGEIVVGPRCLRTHRDTRADAALPTAAAIRKRLLTAVPWRCDSRRAADHGLGRSRIGRRGAVSSEAARLLLGPEDREPRRVADGAGCVRSRLPDERFRFQGQMRQSGDLGRERWSSSNSAAAIRFAGVGPDRVRC
jgi:hypothetical protein